MTHSVNLAPPVSQTSIKFIATSMDIIEIMDIPSAVLKAVLIPICRVRMIVSRAIDVNNPLIMAKDIMCKVGQLISENWKNAIVPRSPIAQPTKHQSVLTLAFFQVGTQSHFTVACESMLAIGLNPHQYALNTLIPTPRPFYEGFNRFIPG